MMDRFEREQLVEDVANKVLSRLSATVDVSDIVNQIEDLRKELDKFYKMFD